PDGSRVEVNENDEVRWATSDKEVVVTPGRAAEISRAKQRRGLDLVIKTPFGVARLPAEPTELSLDIDRRRVAFELRMGNVGFVDGKGKHIELRMGSRIEVMLSGIEVIRPDGTRAKLAAGETEALE